MNEDIAQANDSVEELDDFDDEVAPRYVVPSEDPKDARRFGRTASTDSPNPYLGYRLLEHLSVDEIDALADEWESGRSERSLNQAMESERLQARVSLLQDDLSETADRIMSIYKSLTEAQTTLGDTEIELHNLTKKIETLSSDIGNAPMVLGFISRELDRLPEALERVRADFMRNEW
jgi:peptidoglycan hydrolase CwlO-like protein